MRKLTFVVAAMLVSLVALSGSDSGARSMWGSPDGGLDGQWVELAGSATGKGITNNEGDSSWTSIALDSDGFPMVVWQDNTPTRRTDPYLHQIYAKKWTGSEWVDMGSGSSAGAGISNSAKSAEQPFLISDRKGNIYAAWMDNASGKGKIYLKKFERR